MIYCYYNSENSENSTLRKDKVLNGALAVLSNHDDSNCLQSSTLSLSQDHNHKCDNSVMISTLPTMTQLESIASPTLHSVNDSCYPAPLTVYHLDSPSPSSLSTDHHDSLTPSNMQINQKLQSILPSNNQPDSLTLSISSTISQPDSVKYIQLNDMHTAPLMVSDTQVQKTDHQKQLKEPTDCKEVETQTRMVCMGNGTPSI